MASTDKTSKAKNEKTVKPSSPKKNKASAPRKSPKGKKGGSPSRRWARIAALVIPAVVLALCIGGNVFVHHPPQWVKDHHSLLTAPLEYFGNRTALLTDALGWTGHDAVYGGGSDFDEPPPSGQVFFAGEPERRGNPAPRDIVTLDRGEFMVGWSPSLQHPVWAAYHVPRDARFDGNGKRPGFRKDPSVARSPAPGNYESAKHYNRGHMVPNRAIVTRFGPDFQKKTFLMTNIAPQTPALNCGPWREMEQHIADLWAPKYGELWVIVGTISNPDPKARKILEGTQIDIPEKYYMIVVGQDDDGIRALALLFDHEQTGKNDFPVYNIVTLAELEAAAGIDFFPDMPKFLKKPLYVDRPTRLWPCRFSDLFKLIMIRFT